MAVLIRDMEMPQSCVDCRFRSDGWCYAIPEGENQPGETRNDTRPDWCPLVEVPKPNRVMSKDEMEAAGFEI